MATTGFLQQATCRHLTSPRLIFTRRSGLAKVIGRHADIFLGVSTELHKTFIVFG